MAKPGKRVFHDRYSLFGQCCVIATGISVQKKVSDRVQVEYKDSLNRSNADHCSNIPF